MEGSTGNEPGLLQQFTLLGCFTICMGIMAYFAFKWIQWTEKHDSNDTSTALKTEGCSNQARNSQKSKAIDKVKDKGNSAVTKSKEKESYQHELLYTTLKGHTGTVTCLSFSSNFQYLASTSTDGTIRVWTTKDFHHPDHKQFRTNLKFDIANKVSFSPDNKALLISKVDDRNLEVFKIVKKVDTGASHIETVLCINSGHKAEIVGLGIASSGKFMMSCSKDGRLAIWSLKKTLEKDLMLNGIASAAKISLNGQYVGVCGVFGGSDKERAELLIYQVVTSDDPEFKNNVLTSFQKVPPSGNSIGISDFEFNSDTSKVAVVTPDLKWKLLDISGSRVSTDCDGVAAGEPGTKESNPIIRLSQDGFLMIVGAANILSIFSIQMGGLLLGKIEGIHSSDSIRDLVFFGDGAYFLSTGDKFIHIFRNVPGMIENRRNMENLISLKSTSAGVKKRLKEEIEELNKELSEFGTQFQKDLDLGQKMEFSK